MNRETAVDVLNKAINELIAETMKTILEKTEQPINDKGRLAQGSVEGTALPI